MLTLNELIELTKEVESEDPIDWGYLNIDEDTATRMIALNVLGMYDEWVRSGDPKTVMLVTITKLILENFVLNLKRQQGIQ